MNERYYILTEEDVRELFETDWGIVPASIEPNMTPLVQDDHALATIDAEAPVVPYPLLNEDRRTAGVWRLFVYFWRLALWRWKSRVYK